MKQETNQANIQLLTAQEAATLCRLSKRSWLRLSASGRIPAPARIGGSLRWKLSEIELFLECKGDMAEFHKRKEARDVK